MVKNHYDDLIHNRIPKIKRSLKCSYESLQKAIQEIAKLDLHPGLQFSSDIIPPIVPDVIVREEEGHFSVEINEENTPTIHLNSKYLRLYREESTSTEIKECIKKYYLSAKWFVRNIYQRNDTLIRLVNYLLEKQRAFFEQDVGRLVPLNMKEVAEALEVHESTVARVVSHKYVHTPRGTFSLRSFFTHAFVSEKGEELSSETVKTALKEIIAKEDKSKPLSDQTISETLKERGIPCARRTVTKYRKLFGIASAKQRRKFQQK
jgi:RNA polymerase sigma-54 factor